MLAIKKASINVTTLLALVIATAVAAWFSICSAQEAHWHDLYDEGHRAIDAHDYDKGVRLWSQILREMPSTGSHAVGYADIAIHLQRFLPPDYPFMSKRVNPEKERLLRSACEIYARELGQLNSETLAARDQLAWYLQSQNRHKEAGAIISESIMEWKRSRKDVGHGLYNLHRQLSIILTEQKRYKEAAEESEKMLAVARTLKYDGPALAYVLNFLGCDYNRSRQFEKAWQILTEAIKLGYKSSFGPVIPMCNLASTYDGMGRYADSITTFRKALLLLHKSDITGQWKTVLTELQLALVYNKAKQFSNSEPLLHHVIQFAEEKLTKTNLERSEYDRKALINECNLYLIPARAALLEIKRSNSH